MNTSHKARISAPAVEGKEDTYRLATYGTLRMNQGNYRFLLQGRSNHVGTCTTEPRFELHHLGGFPGVCQGQEAIVIDVFEVSGDVLDSVYGLEGYSGVRNHRSNWYDTVDVATPWGAAEMFIMDPHQVAGAPVIESGDWLNR